MLSLSLSLSRRKTIYIHILYIETYITGSNARTHQPARVCSHTFPNYVNAGILDPTIEAQAASCADAKKSVIPTRAECQKAATMLESGRTATLVNHYYVPYCASWGYKMGMYTFDVTETREKGGVQDCKSHLFHCVCNKGSCPHVDSPIHPLPWPLLYIEQYFFWYYFAYFCCC